jgi:hypothetical protein
LGKELTSAVNFVLGPGESLPFENESFSSGSVASALPYMPRRDGIGRNGAGYGPGGKSVARVASARMTVKELGTNLTHLQLKASLYRLWVLLNGLTLSTVGIQTHWPGNSSRYESWQTGGGIKRALVPRIRADSN